MQNKSFFGGVVVSLEADIVARSLIQEFKIPKLNNLAFMLDVNKCFDDHQAIRLWVQSLSEQEAVELEELARKARYCFMNLFS